jgi:Xaa-Pro aminopeptidase
VFLHVSVVQEMKEVKNRTEISGMQQSHSRDCGAAVSQFGIRLNILVRYFRLAYRNGVSRQYGKGIVRVCQIDRISKVVSLILDRLILRDRKRYIGPSFEPHAAVAVNAATITYVPDPDKCAYIGSESMFTLHAGANYQ